MPDVIQLVIQATDAASKVIGVVGASLDKLDASADNANKKLSIFGLTTDQIGSKMTQAGKIATVGLTLPIAGLAVAATKAASDLNETSTKIETLFGNSATAIKKFADTAATSFGQSKKQALDAAADFAIFGKAAGLAGNDLVDFSEKNVKLAADMASFFNTSPEEAITAIGAAFRGESEPIRRYGVLINEASLKDEALRLGLIKTTSEALQPQARVLAAQALIMKQTSAAQGDFERTSGGLANQSRILNAQFQDTVATLGQSLLPIAIKMAGTANDLLKAFNDLDQPTKDLIVGFGLLAAAAGPVLTVGGKLISTFGTLTSVAIDAAGGMVSTGKTIAETAGYLKQVGLSADSLKFAFQNLKAAGVILGAELGIIVAGLIAIAKYLGEVDAASKATSDSLIEMSHSGDVFKQAAATTEILAHGQNRLKDALDATHEKIRAGARDYADYKSSIEATAKAAGYEINAQGNLVQVFYGMAGRQEKLIAGNYLLTESTYKVGEAQNYVSAATLNSAQNMGIFGETVNRAKSGLQNIIPLNQKQIDGMRALAESTRATGEAEQEYQRIVKETVDAIKARNSVIANAYSLAITYTESQRKQADVQKELDDLNAKITARGPAHAAVVKNEKLSAEELARAQLELKVAQEDLTTAKRKGDETDAEFALRLDTLKSKVADYSQKLGEHTAIVGGATKAELEQKAALEGQIAALQKADEVERAKGAFNALTEAFKENILTEDQFKERAAALNAVSGLYTESALKQATAQEVLMKSFADPRSETWRGQLLLNQDAIDGQIKKTDDLATSTKNAKDAMSKAGVPVEVPLVPKTDAGSKEAFQKAAESYAPKAIEVTIKPKAEKVDSAKLAHDLAGDLKYAQPVIAPKIDTKQAEKDLTNYVLITDKTPKEKRTNFVADTTTATKNAQSLLTLFGLTPAKKSTQFDVQADDALKMYDDLYLAQERLHDKIIDIVVRYKTEGEPVSGFQHGGSYIVPANPRGGAGDYFPILAAPGERVTVQTKAQQNATPAPVSSGDTFVYNTNVYNPLAAAMLADKQRRDRLARSNARMGVA